MKSIADDDHPGAGAPTAILRVPMFMSMSMRMRVRLHCGGNGCLRLARMVVIVPPKNKFFQHEERQDTDQDPSRRVVALHGLFENVRKQIQEHDPQQCPHCVAHKQRNQTRLNAPRDQRGEQHRYHATRQAGEHDVEQDHGVFTTG